NCDQGEALALVREPLNSHDSNAVAIFTMSGQQLGYISRDLSAEIAERLDRGSPVTARISDITGGTAERPTFGVNIEVTKHKLNRSQ
ncbi:MAG: HIRAN domain-containing protein, partial [SAR324 cluster bacterium]|nr:HIRAN domain-containing protein [SAR324 cluster bacterium]